MRAVGYVRVSKREQAESGLGLDAQRETITDAALARGWELADIFVDAGASGGLAPEKRPGLRDALAALADPEHGYGVLLVAKLDRLSRQMSDFAEIIKTAQAQGWQIVALDLGVDTSTPAGELVASIMAAMAHFERRLIGERTKSALAQAKKRGVVLGRPIDLDPAVARTIYRRFYAGASLGAIARGLNEDGVPTARGGVKWYASTVKSILDRLEREGYEA